MDLLSSDASWPRHTNPEWRQTLRVAQDHGWHFRPSDGHIFGTLQCRDAPQGERCQQIIFSSGKATDNVAISTRQKIDRCPHVLVESQEAADSAQMTVGQIATMLTKAERLLRAAHSCQREASHRARCEELLSEADASLDRCDELLERATVADLSAAEAAAATLNHLAAAGSQSGADALTLVHEVEDLVGVAEAGLDSVRPVSRAQELRDRLTSLRQDASELRKFLRT